MVLSQFSNINNKYLVLAESISNVNLLSLALCLATSLSSICCSGVTTNCSTCISWSNASLARFISILAQSDKMVLQKIKFWLIHEKLRSVRETKLKKNKLLLCYKPKKTFLLTASTLLHCYAQNMPCILFLKHGINTNVKNSLIGTRVLLLAMGTLRKVLRTSHNSLGPIHT